MDTLLPQGVIEITLWCALSVSAGFFEEFVYRGYLQKQFHALTGSLALAVLAQALVFGIAHACQGTTQVAVITGLGVLAAWRKNLRPGIVAHVWSGPIRGHHPKTLRTASARAEGYPETRAVLITTRVSVLPGGG
jgi:hypothetical protein